MVDLVQAIKREKNQQIIHISTDLKEACGGYTEGPGIYRYTIEIEREGLYTMNQIGALSGKPETLESPSRVSPLLVLNAPQIENATMIAYSCYGDDTLKEVAFLTHIPYEQITGYRDPDGREWVKSPNGEGWLPKDGSQSASASSSSSGGALSPQGASSSPSQPGAQAAPGDPSGNTP